MPVAKFEGAWSLDYNEDYRHLHRLVAVYHMVVTFQPPPPRLLVNLPREAVGRHDVVRPEKTAVDIAGSNAQAVCSQKVGNMVHQAMCRQCQ